MSEVLFSNTQIEINEFNVTPSFTESVSMGHFNWNEDLTQLISNNAPLALVVHAKDASEVLFQRVEAVYEANNTILLILCLDESDSKALARVSNLPNVFSVLSINIGYEELGAAIQAALKDSRAKLKRDRLISEIAHVNKRLEKLTVELDRKARVRTEEIESSRSEAREKQKQTESLVHIVQRLGAARDYEEFVQVVREEHKVWHAVVGPMLLTKNTVGTNQLVCYIGRNLKTISAPIKINTENLISPASEALRKEFSNVLGRPCANIISVKLRNHYLLFEHTFKSDQLTDFEEYIKLNRNAFEVPLERIFQDQELRSVASRWEKTFDVFTDSVAIIDENYEVLRSNKPFREDRVTGKCYEQFANRVAPCESCPMPTSIKSKKNETALVSKESNIFEVSAFPMNLTSMENERYFIHFYRNVTQSKLLYSQLIQNEKVAALGQLAGNVAHELNNPLTGIRSLTQVLVSEESEDTEFKSDLKDIESAATRCQGIIKNLLDFSFQSETETQLIAFDEIVELTLPLVKTATRHLSLNVELEAKKRRVSVEPQLIQQVIFNLINNAGQASREKGSLWLKSRVERDRVFFSVEDDGPGVPKDLVESIFLPFFTTKKRGEGTGLGLSLCRTILKSFDGTLVYRGRIGGGACFEISLPLIEES